VFEITEVAGAGDDEFAKLKSAGGTDVGWYRAKELAPAVVVDDPEPVAEQEAGAYKDKAVTETNITEEEGNVADLEDEKMSITLKAFDGTTHEVEPDDVQSFIDNQVEAQRVAATPEDGSVVNASEHDELKGQVTSLNEQIETLTAKNAEQATAAHVVDVTAALDNLQNEGRISKPQRDWALAEYPTPDRKEAFDRWVEAVPEKPIVHMGGEVGSGVDEQPVDATDEQQLSELAASIQKDKGVDFREALREASRQRNDLSDKFNTVGDGGTPRGGAGNKAYERIAH
jgi:hypothetical protein